MVANDPSGSIRTKPYEKVELTPVMMLMMEKDTPKFYGRVHELVLQQVRPWLTQTDLEQSEVAPAECSGQL